MSNWPRQGNRFRNEHSFITGSSPLGVAHHHINFMAPATGTDEPLTPMSICSPLVMLTLTLTSWWAFLRGLTHTVIWQPRRAGVEVRHLEQVFRLYPHVRVNFIHLHRQYPFVFTSPLIEVFHVAEKAVAVSPEFRVRPAPVLRGMPYVLAQGQSVSPDWSAVPNTRVRSLDVHAGGSNEHDIGRRSIHGR
jgi:hypothetical protein